jgi:signal transduction histidine kinase
MNRTYEASTPELARGSEEASIRTQLALLREQQERLFDSMQSGQRHFKRLARSVWRVQEEERRRLARDLHDGIGQNLTALKHQVEAMLASGALPEELAARAQAALTLCTDTLEDTRALSRMLRPQILDDLGLDAALRWLARSMSESAGFAVELDIGALPQPLDPEFSTLLFRVAQEALTNVARHARAHHVLLRLALRDDALQLLVADDGIGCDSSRAFGAGSAGASTGLGGVRERVALFGGRLHFNAEPGVGTQLRVSLPIDPEARP